VTDLVAGVDMATAEVRVAVATAGGEVVARSRAPLPGPDRPRPGWSQQDARAWWPTVAAALRQATGKLADRGAGVAAVAVSATSGTVVLADADGEPLGPAIMYDDQRARPDERWCWLLEQSGAGELAAHAWHESDLVVAGLTGDRPPTDWSHALKTGFDPATGEWARGGTPARLLPEVLPPASPAGTVTGWAASRTGLPTGCQVRLGMTDACAAQVAAGADRPGRFVTILGTTLAVKGATQHRVEDGGAGVYSHRHPNGWWLPGGASNVGAGALADDFGDRDLATMDRAAAARGPAGCVRYPLPRRGERFPFAAPDAEAFWLGRPADDVDAYRATLEGVAFVERLAYERLGRLGATATAPVGTAGGGSRSGAWSAIRATVMNMPVVRSPAADTAVGAAILAAAGTVHPDLPAATRAMVGPPDRAADPVEDERERLDRGYTRFVDALVERGWL
jgi:sugar (pentulose or hexulose) kinase